MIEDKAFWGLIGVALGFFLNVVYSYILKRIRVYQLNKALHEECRSLLTQIPQLVDIFKKCIDNLDQGRILPGPAVRSLSIVYRSTISEIYPYLSLKNRNLLHVVYERLRVGDDILENYVSILSRELQEKLLEDPIQGWIIRMKDQLESYKTTTVLLKSYLRGEPIDVFTINGK